MDVYLSRLYIIMPQLLYDFQVSTLLYQVRGERVLHTNILFKQ